MPDYTIGMQRGTNVVKKNVPVSTKIANATGARTELAKAAAKASQAMPKPATRVAAKTAHAGRPVETLATPADTPSADTGKLAEVAKVVAASAEAPSQGAPKPEAPKTGAAAPGAHPLPNFEALSLNMARLVEEGAKVASAYLQGKQADAKRGELGDEVAGAVKTIGKVAEHWLKDPARALKAQAALSSGFLSLWSHTLKRLSGEASEPVAPPPPGDKRYSDPEWKQNPFYDFLAQAHTLTSNWANDLAKRADSLDPHTRDRAGFYIRQISSAVSPANFVGTNPELMRETLAQSGENLVRGMHMLAEDIEAGKGKLRIRQTDASKFKLGVNMATTPGKVVLRNELIELIQYAPTTPQVYKRPLLIVPPWINKFYVLDLNPEKSFIRWAVAQGLTVFVISWVNPDERHAHKGFEHYMREGIFAALDQMEKITGERDAAAVGYCVGGTLLAVALAHMAATGDTRISSATFFTTQVDFRKAGDLQIFVDAEQIASMEGQMKAAGYLDGAQMANAFNMLRPNELIWSYVINNYLKGKEPMPFDLLTWNSDSTRMPAANHSFYMRNCYLENNLTQGKMQVGGVKLDLGKVTVPVYNLAAKEDHIAPAESVFIGSQFFGGPMRYVMAGSGHIAGVVNPPARAKYQYWSGEQPAGDFADWVAKAVETPGSWWPDWLAWLSAQAPEKVGRREPGGGKVKTLGDAPGEYVRVKV